MRHTFEAHSTDQNARFTCRYCPQTFGKYSSMISHLSRKHKGISLEKSVDEEENPFVNVDDDSDKIGGSDDDQHQTYPTCERRERITRSAALFLLNMKERHKLTQAAIDFAVGQVRSMVTYALQDMQASVQQAVASGASATDIVDLMDMSIDPFGDISTEYKQTKYYRENFNLVVCTYILPVSTVHCNIILSGTRDYTPRDFF